MPQAANPTSDINLFTPPPGDPHSVPHPFIRLPSPLGPNFTLVKSPNGLYQLSFSNGMAPSTNNNHAAARVYVAAFSTSVSSPDWTHTQSVPPNHDRMLTIVTIDFAPGLISGATALWVGSWWDDGTYPDSQPGVIAYFADHPSGGSHHTVPIIPG